MTARELLEARRADLTQQIVKLSARLAEIEHLIIMVDREGAITTARSPRTIKRETKE